MGLEALVSVHILPGRVHERRDCTQHIDVLLAVGRGDHLLESCHLLRLLGHAAGRCMGLLGSVLLVGHQVLLVELAHHVGSIAGLVADLQIPAISDSDKSIPSKPSH